jgi:hypothetical protein
LRFDRWSFFLVGLTLLVSLCGYTLSWIGIVYFGASEANPFLNISPTNEVIRLALILIISVPFITTTNNLPIRRILLGAVLAFFSADAVWDVVALTTNQDVYLMAFSAFFTASVISGLVGIVQIASYTRTVSRGGKS